MSNLRESLLTVGFGSYSGKFASGVEANNKLDLDAVPRNATLRNAVVEGIKQLIKENEIRFDLVLPVPYGANWLGYEIAAAHKAEYLPLRKGENKQIMLNSGADQEVINLSERIIIIEDVPNGLTSVRRTLALPGVMERTVAVFGIFDRGDPATRQPLPEGILLRSLVEESIPPMLPPESELWKYAS